MAQPWPVSLQEKLNASGFGIDYGDSLVRSDMDVGLAKVRNRYTKGIDTYTASIYVDITDVLIFESFYKDTLVNGALPFTFNDPITQIPTDFRFRSPPKISPLGGISFTISFVWERLP